MNPPGTPCRCHTRQLPGPGIPEPSQGHLAQPADPRGDPPGREEGCPGPGGCTAAEMGPDRPQRLPRTAQLCQSSYGLLLPGASQQPPEDFHGGQRNIKVKKNKIKIRSCPPWQPQLCIQSVGTELFSPILLDGACARTATARADPSPEPLAVLVMLININEGTRSVGGQAAIFSCHFQACH